MRAVKIGLGIGFFLLLGLCALAGFVAPLDFAFTLVLGWVVYVFRVIPQTSIDWGGVATAALCLLGLVGGLHWFLRWLYGQMRKPGEPDLQPAPTWKLRWTLALVALVVLMFVAGISAVGLSHQTVWLATSPMPIFGGGGTREVATRYQVQNSLKQMALAIHGYHDEHKCLPSGATFDERGTPLHSWQTSLLPYYGKGKLWKSINQKLPWDSTENAPAFQTVLEDFLCPDVPMQRNREGYALSHFAANSRVLGTNTPVTFADLQAKAGAGYTILAGEAAGRYKPWGHPLNWRDPALGINKSPAGFGSRTRPGALFLYADGHVELLPENGPQGRPQPGRAGADK